MEKFKVKIKKNSNTFKYAIIDYEILIESSCNNFLSVSPCSKYLIILIKQISLKYLLLKIN